MLTGLPSAIGYAFGRVTGSLPRHVNGAELVDEVVNGNINPNISSHLQIYRPDIYTVIVGPTSAIARCMLADTLPKDKKHVLAQLPSSGPVLRIRLLEQEGGSYNDKLEVREFKNAEDSVSGRFFRPRQGETFDLFAATQVKERVEGFCFYHSFGPNASKKPDPATGRELVGTAAPG